MNCFLNLDLQTSHIPIDPRNPPRTSTLLSSFKIFFRIFLGRSIPEENNKDWTATTKKKEKENTTDSLSRSPMIRNNTES
jgi:hypothetical protein